MILIMNNQKIIFHFNIQKYINILMKILFRLNGNTPFYSCKQIFGISWPKM